MLRGAVMYSLKQHVSYSNAQIPAHQPRRPIHRNGRAAWRGHRPRRAALHRQDPAGARRRDRGPAVAGKPVDLFRRAFRRDQFFQCQPHQRRLQESVDGGHQGGQLGRHLRLRARPVGDRRVHAQWRLARLGGHVYPQGRPHPLRVGRALPGQGQFRGRQASIRKVRRQGQPGAVQSGRRIPGADGRHRLHRSGRPPRAHRGARRRRCRDGQQEGQGHRRRETQDAGVQ